MANKDLQKNYKLAVDVLPVKEKKMDAENDKNIPKEKEKVPNIEREGWETKKVAEEGVNESPDDVLRKVLRDDEGKTAGDEQDIVGSSDFKDTPQGREENKKGEGDK